MNELGQILREARETKGLTLAEVQAAIRINARFLEALETGEYNILPTAVHVRGFLRNYARYLGLDPQPLLERYEINQQQRPQRQYAGKTASPPEITPDSPLPVRDDQPFFTPVNMEVDSRSGRGSDTILRLVIIGALLISLYLVGSRFLPRVLSNEDGQQALTDGITDVWQSIISSGEETAVDPAGLTDENAVTLEASSVLTSTGRNILPTPNPTRPPLPPTMETIELQILITERTWMEVTVDGDVVFSGIARKDDTFAWTADEEVKLLTGNAYGVAVTINEVQIGRLGDRQETKEEVWVTTN